MQKTPWDDVFDQIAELMQAGYDNAQKPVSPKKAAEAEKKLNALEKKVYEFKAIADKFVEEAGVTDYVFNEMLSDEENDINVVLKRAEDLKAEAKKASQDVLNASQDAKASGKQLTTKKKEVKPKSPQARKGKFKSMGGFKNWKPL